MQKIELPTDNIKYNYQHALKTINSSGMSRKDMTLNFIQDKDKYYCLIVLTDEERDRLPEQLKLTSISYKNLKSKALS